MGSPRSGCYHSWVLVRPSSWLTDNDFLLYLHMGGGEGGLEGERDRERERDPVSSFSYIQGN